MQMQTVSMESMLEMLREIAGESDLDVTVPLADLGLDSLDILEWLYEVEEQFGVEFADDVELEKFAARTLTELYAAFVELLDGSAAAEAS